VANNDDKIKETLAVINKKKIDIGVKPRAVWRSNGIIKFGSDNVNINTISKIDVCVEITARLMQENYFLKEAAKVLKVNYDYSTITDYLNDLQVRTAMLTFDVEKKKLDAMEAQLKDLRSGDAKTSDAIADIMASL
jgi:hypothetical protein